MLLDPLTGELHDPYGGQADLAAKILRPVDPVTFLEDPLRALRVVQFAARLEMSPTDDLIALCRSARLDELPAERVEGEWRKLLFAPKPSLGLAVARRADILSRVFPTFTDDDAVDPAVDRLASVALAPEGRRDAGLLGAWLHRTPAAGVEPILDRLGLYTLGGYALRERLLAALATWTEDPRDDAALRHLSTRTELRLTLSVRQAVTGEAQLLERAEALGIALEPPPRLLLGRHLASLVPPGPRMGEILTWVYERQLDGAVTTLDEALAAAKTRL
jgi:tRNA nucleotidyltransferase (CCA-adding enzyme)